MSFELDKVGDYAMMRAKHTDGEGNFSINYEQAEIETEEIPFFNLYKVSDNNRKLVRINQNTGSIIEVVKQWLPDYHYETDYIMAWNLNESRLYRITRQSVDEDTNVVFERVSFASQARKKIPLSGNDNSVFEGLSCMVYLSDYFVFIGNQKFCSLSADGTYVVLGEDITLTSLVYNDTSLYGAYNSTNVLSVVDISNGSVDVQQDINLTITEGGGTYISTVSLTRLNSIVYGIANVQIGEITVPRLVSIDLNSGEVNNLGPCSIAFQELGIGIVDEDFKLIGATQVSSEDDSLLRNAVYQVNSSTGETQDLIMQFNNNKVDDNSTLTCRDKTIFRLVEQENQSDSESDSKILLQRTDPYSLKVTEIQLSNYPSIYIDDGGFDMYDDGNYMGTDRIETSVPYTHTSLTEVSNYEDNSNFEIIGDGTIEDGSDWFGPGSTYFTNLYAGFFVLAVQDMDIHSFHTGGGLGADGNGTIFAGETTITIGDIEYYIAYKQVCAEYDASVGHIFIVPNKEGLEHIYSENTDEDSDEIAGLSELNCLYYILFSTRLGGGGEEEEGGGVEVTEEDIVNIATAFLNIKVDSTDEEESPSFRLDNFLENLNDNSANITDEIPDVYMFTDSNDNSIEFTTAMTAIDEDFHVVLTNYNEGNFFSISNEGELEQIGNPDNLPIFGFSGMTSIRNTIYGVDLFTNYLMKVDPSTGIFINKSDPKFDTTIVVNDNSINGLYGLAAYGPDLFAIAQVEGEPSLIKMVDSDFNGFQGAINAEVIGQVDDYSSIFIELIPSSMQLFSLSIGDSQANRYSSSFHINPEDGSVVDILKRWIPDYSFVSSLAMVAGADDKVYRIYHNSQGTFFESYSNVFEFIENVPILHYELADSEIYGLACHLQTNTFLIDSSNGFYHLTTEGTLTRISNTLNSKGLTFRDTTLYCITGDNNLNTVNIADGAIQFVTAITATGGAVTNPITMISHSNILYAVVSVDSVRSLVEISLEGDSVVQCTCDNFISMFSKNETMYGVTGFSTETLELATVYEITQITPTMGVTLITRLDSYLGAYRQVQAWNPLDRKMYYLATGVDDRTGADKVFFYRVDPSLLIKEELEFTEEIQNVQAMVYFENNVFHVVADSTLYTVQLNETVVIENVASDESLSGVSGIAYTESGNQLFAVAEGSSVLFTMNTISGVLSTVAAITVEGYVVTSMKGIAINENNIMYGIFEDDNNATHLIEINFETTVGTYKGPMNEFTSLAFGLAPRRKNILDSGYYYEEDDNITIQISKDNISMSGNNLRIEWIYDWYSNIHDDSTAPEDGWNRAEMASFSSDSSYYYIKLNMLFNSRIALRIAYRNPNSKWVYIQED